MKTKIAIALLACLTFGLPAQIVTNLTATNLDGRVYTNLTITHADEIGFIWTQPDGTMGRLKFIDMKPEDLKALHVTDAQVIKAIATEEKANAFWARKSYFDAIYGPIEFENAQLAAERAAEQTEIRRQSQPRNGPLYYSSVTYHLSAGDIEAARRMTLPKHR